MYTPLTRKVKKLLVLFLRVILALFWGQKLPCKTVCYWKIFQLLQGRFLQTRKLNFHLRHHTRKCLFSGDYIISVHKRALRLKKKQFLKSVKLTTLRTKSYYRLSIDWRFRYKQAVVKWEIRTKSNCLKTLSYYCVSRYIRVYIY